MRLYITEMTYADAANETLTVWHGTKSAAMSHSRKNKSKWSEVYVPTRKADLIMFLNKLSDNGDGSDPAPPLVRKPPPTKAPVRRGARA
jgi:hypothetical protein